MKKGFIIAFVAISLHLLAQQPEKIYNITIQPRDDSFYTTQAQLWKKEVARKPKDASAWENYYWAMRYSNHIYKGGHADKQKVMKQIVDDMGKNVPNTIQYYHCELSYYGWPRQDTAEASAMLNKAIALQPNDRGILEDYISYSAVTGKPLTFTEMVKRLYGSNTYADGIMEMGYNILMSADKNAILFTWGDNDTYTAWMLQQAKNIRTDITIINVPLAMGYPGYLNTMLKEKNIVLPAGFSKQLDAAANMADFIKMLVLEINKINSAVPLCMATTNSVLENVFPDSLYCTGLAWRFSTTRMDNLSELQNNIENHFHLDYLDGGVYDNGPSQALVEQCNALYVTPFAILYRHYKAMGESNGRTAFYKTFVMNYAAKAGKKQEMKEYLNGK